MLDIIFISYDEPDADQNWAHLKSFYPHAKRVHGIRGIANAHMAAAKKANTSFFYVVDADAELLPSFDFSYKPEPYDAEWVHIWHAYNPAIKLSYGYGGVKLFNKKHFRNITTALDFSTTLARGVKIHTEDACITRFNSDPYRAFRGAFREAAKLAATVNDTTKSQEVRNEANTRLNAWQSVDDSVDYVNYIREGVLQGVTEAAARAYTDLMFINDHDLVVTLLSRFDAGVDLTYDPTLPTDHPMSSEFSFITRIASALYDPYVHDNLHLDELRDAISDGQLYSKIWLIDELRPRLGNFTSANPAKVAILGGWIGLLAYLMFVLELPVEVVSVDLDGRANTIAEKINWDKKFSTLSADMYGVDYTGFDVIINTSSEHIPDIPKWRDSIPDDKVLVVQNNNYEEGAGHVSTVPNSARLRSMLKLKSVAYDGTRQFPQYNRFMIIGRT